MSRLSFSEEGKCSSADEEGNEEGEKESEKGMVWEELEMGFNFTSCVQITTEHIPSFEVMCG